MQRRATPERADDARFVLSRVPPLLWLQWRPRIAIQHRDVVAVGAAIAASGDPGLPLLVEIAALREVSWEARDAILAYEHPSRIALLGSDAVDLVLTAFTVKSRAETRFFTDRPEAVLWLLG